MKKKTTIILAVITVLLATGCGSTTAQTDVDAATSKSSAPTLASDSGRAEGDDLITAQTPLDAVCSVRLKGGRLQKPTVDIETFGQAWEKIADGKDCDLEGAADYTFAWDGFDEEGFSVPRPEYRAVVEKAWAMEGRDGLKDSEDAELKVTNSIKMCHYYDDDVMSAKEGMDGSIRYAIAALELCPDHPQAQGWEELASYLPQAQKKFDDTVQRLEAEDKAKAEQEAAEKDKAEADAKAAQEKAAEANKNFAEDGSRDLIGVTLNPGLYQTMGPVEQCYWEISDATGNIIDNNFINVAPQFELYIPATASGFYINGCAMKRIGD